MTLPVISKSLASRVAKDMNTKGYSLIDTSLFLSRKTWPSQKSLTFKALNGKKYGHYISLKECMTDWITEFVGWQDKLLHKALPNENLRIESDSLSIRNEKHKTDRKVCNWHVDGHYIRSLCVMKGEPTLIMTELGESPIPLGWTLFITASGRNKSIPDIPGTLHRRPRTKKLRRLIVHGWYGQKPKKPTGD